MRKTFPALLGVTLFALTAATVWITRGPSPDMLVSTLPQSSATPAAGSAQIGGEFTLTDQTGNTVTAETLKGKLQLVFFGFTHCPDICPVSLMTISNVMEQLGDKASQVQPVFISVDPERDTPTVLKAYASNFHPSLLALTGSEAQVKQATDAYKVYASKGEVDQNGYYSVDHSGFIYLMDRDGRYLNHFRHSDPEQQILSVIRPHIQ